MLSRLFKSMSVRMMLLCGLLLSRLLSCSSMFTNGEAMGMPTTTCEGYHTKFRRFHIVDGLGLKFAGDFIKSYFELDSFGSLIPTVQKLNLSDCQKGLSELLSANNGLYRRMTELYYRTDVEFTDNPYGNTPTWSFGLRRFGKRPLTGLKFAGKMQAISGNDEMTASRLEKRESRIIAFQSEILSLHKSLEPRDDPKTRLIWQVEGDQAMTGGGFDGNAIGEVHKSALKFVAKSSTPIDYKDTVLSKYVIEEALNLRDYFKQSGLVEGSLRPVGASVVRFLQDNDGMIGYPVYAKGNAPLTKDISMRLLQVSGVDTRRFVDLPVTDRNNQVTYKYRIIDAIAYILDNKIISPTDTFSNITLLARIQKHGWKYDDQGKIIPKPGKTRSVYPNAAIPGVIEAMIMQPFLSKLQENKVSIMPSLQDKPTRVSMITELINEWASKDYDFLAADWSQYDATVKGAILATIIYYAVRPFYSASYQQWVDYAIWCLTYKYIICDTNLCRINRDEFDEAKKAAPFFEVENFTVFGLVDGLISGAKFTHVGGSLYGEVAIHRVIPRLMGYRGIFGPQAGDDTLLGIPKNLIDSSSSEKTYAPIRDAAAQLGLEINPSKQIWHQYDGEIVKVFLQELYQHNLDIYGIGSSFRPLDALPFMEREKGLSPAEQEAACISRMQQGADNPFIKDTVRYWFQQDPYLGVLFKEFGTSAFDVIIQSTGKSSSEVAHSVGIDSYSFGTSLRDFESGNLSIIPIMAEVASQTVFDVSVSQALKSIDPEGFNAQSKNYDDSILLLEDSNDEDALEDQS